MRHLAFGVALLIPLAARAADVPTALLLPTAGLQQLRQYLGGRPHDEVAGYIALIEQCVQVQLPKTGAPPAHGECQPVSDRLKADADALAAAVRKQKDEDAEHEKKVVAEALAKAKTPAGN
jgi:hypothetical protein